MRSPTPLTNKPRFSYGAPASLSMAPAAGSPKPSALKSPARDTARPNWLSLSVLVGSASCRRRSGPEHSTSSEAPVTVAPAEV